MTENEPPASTGPEAEAEQPPSPREAMAPVVEAVRQRAARASRHTPAPAAVAGARAAAQRPETEQQRKAATATVVGLSETAQEDTRGFDRTSFEEALRRAIEETTATPTTEEQAERVITTGATDASETLETQLAVQNDAAVGPLKNQAATEVTPDPGTMLRETTLVPEQVGAPPEPVSAAPAVPAPLPPEQLDYSQHREATDAAMADHGVTKEQLEKGNEPEFGQTLEARSEAEQHEARTTPAYRAFEAGQRDAAAQEAQSALTGGLAGMQAARAARITTVAGRQTGTQTREEAERQRITESVEHIKNETRSAVETILTDMENEVSTIFGQGLAAAENAYRDVFEEEKGGRLTWATESLFGDWEKHIEDSLNKARKAYLHHVNIAIGKVADRVDTGLAAAKRRVAEGRRKVEDFVSTLGINVRAFGEQALASVSAEFTAMEEGIDSRAHALVGKCTNQFKASYERMSAMEQEFREANKSLWQRVYDATVGAVEKIIAFKDMLLGVLAKAGDVVGDIIADPIGFLGNLISGMKGGILRFKDNILDHLRKGLMGWLFGALAQGGIELPDTFDLKGIVKLLASIFGLTWARIRARIVKQIGEPAMAAIEKAVEIFQLFATQGVAGLWQLLLEKVGNLKDMIVEKVKDFVVTKVITAGITWLISLLNPAAAFFKACKIIYDIIMFFVNNASRIADFVNTILDSVADIARGNVGGVVAKVENVLGRMVPILIGFLASILNVGDIGQKIREIVEALQKPVEKAVDAVITAGLRLAGPIIHGIQGFRKSLKAKASASKAYIERRGEAVVSTVRDAKKVFLARLFGPQRIVMKGASHSVFLEVHAGKHVVMMASYKARLADKVYRALKNKEVQENAELVDHLLNVQENIREYEEAITKYTHVEIDTKEARRQESDLNEYSRFMISQLAAIGKVLDLDILKGGIYVLDGHVHPDYMGKGRIRLEFYGPSSDYEHHRGEKTQKAVSDKLLRYQNPLEHPDKFWCPGYGKRKPHLASLAILELDHIEPVAAHWQRLGRNTSQDERHKFYVDGSNIQAMCHPCNKAKGSGGARYETAVGPNFTGRGGVR